MTSACRFLLALLLAALASLSVAAGPAKPPKPLLAQIQRLGELLRDSHAVLYPEATQVQFVSPRKGEEMALTMLTVEGFGGGNSHVQYLAAFSTEISDQGKPHYSLIDVVQIAGKGWRIHVEVPAEPVDGTIDARAAVINREVERIILRQPLQYLWAYNRYKVPAGVRPPPSSTTES